MPDPVIDVGSNLERNLDRWSRALKGGGDKLSVFKIIYSGKRRRWTAKQISEALDGKVSPKRVTEVGKRLAGDTLIHQVPDEYPVIYEKRDDVHHYKKNILSRAKALFERVTSLARNTRLIGNRKIAIGRPLPSRHGGAGTANRKKQPDFDVFLSHATEDKDFVRPLAAALKKGGVRVWYDNDSMGWGDDLRTSIDKGLANSKYGIVVFSRAFLKRKHWTEHELNGLFAKERVGRKVILPIWHKITADDLLEYSPAFADRIAKISTKDSVDEIVLSVKNLIRK
jgi:hypothetical protein